MAEEKSGGISVVVGGIAEALVTTALGLAVAWPAVWMFNYFNSQLRSFAVEINQSSNELINFFQAKDADSHSAE
jgi:biopolymer transport protein ExbB